MKVYVHCVAHIRIAWKKQILMDNLLHSVFISHSTRLTNPRVEVFESFCSRLTYSVLTGLHNSLLGKIYIGHLQVSVWMKSPPCDIS